MTRGELLIEKRKYPRWQCSLDVKYKVLKDEKLGKFKEIFQKFNDIKTKDMSGDGALLITEEPLKVKDKITMKIYFPSSDNTIKIFAEAIRVSERDEKGVRKYFTGVKYINIITESDDVLEEIIEQKLNASKKTGTTKEEVLKLAQVEYLLKLLHEEVKS
ncbi:MAG: PilZ domain-containing protein [Candidatus Firestonebacteria bacterium]